MKKKLFALFMALCLVTFFSGSISYAAGSAKITGNIETGKVEIGVSLSGFEGEIKPGETAKEILTIKNKGTDCFIRITPIFKGIDGVGPENLLGISDQWTLKNGIYYYKNKLNVKEEIRFCDAIMIPKDAKSGNLSLEFVADALQSANITPDFTKDSPWGEVEVNAVNERGEGYEVKLVSAVGANENPLEVRYNDDLKEMVPNFDEIFETMPAMHPGDSYTEVIDIYNPTNSPKEIVISENGSQDELKKHIEVTFESCIDGETKEIFSGKLMDASRLGAMSAGTIEPKDEASLIIKTHMSEDAGNEASALRGNISLAMAAGDANETVPEEIIKTATNIKSAKTGEDERTISKLLIISSMLLAAGLLLIKTAENNERKRR